MKSVRGRVCGCVCVERERGMEGWVAVGAEGAETMRGPCDRSDAPDAQGIPDVMSVDMIVRSEDSAAWPSGRSR